MNKVAQNIDTIRREFRVPAHRRRTSGAAALVAAAATSVACETTLALGLSNYRV